MANVTTYFIWSRGCTLTCTHHKASYFQGEGLTVCREEFWGGGGGGGGGGIPVPVQNSKEGVGGSYISRGRGVIPVHTSGGEIQISSDIIVPNLPHIDSACD